MLIVAPGRHVHRDSLAWRQAEPPPGLRRLGRGLADEQRVVARVPGLADLSGVLEGLAHNRGAEWVRRQEQIPLRDVTGHEIEEPAAAREAWLDDVVAEALERSSVPGLHVSLAGAAAMGLGHMVVRDQVAGPAERSEVVGRPDQHGPAVGWRWHATIAHCPDQFALVASTAEFVGDGQRAVGA